MSARSEVVNEFRQAHKALEFKLFLSILAF